MKIIYNSDTISGLGDRLIDLCSVMTDYPNFFIIMIWNKHRDLERSSYDTNNIKIQNGIIINNNCVYDDNYKYVKTKNNLAGTSLPSLDKIELFRNMAKRIQPSKDVENVLPNKEYICIHIRCTDKIANTDDPIYTNYEFLHNAKQKCINFIKKHPYENYFICTDDQNIKSEFLKELNMDINLININYGNLDKAIVDFFAISRSKLVIQMCRYSTFSMFASIVGGIPLLNFDEFSNKMGNWWNWKPFLILCSNC